MRDVFNPERDFFSELVSLRQRVAALENPSGSQKAGTTAKTAQNVSDIQTTLTYLTAMQKTGYADSGDSQYTLGTGWCNDARPSASISSPSGKVRVTMSCAENNGQCFATFSVSGAASISRDSRWNVSDQRRLLNCMTLSGGASYWDSKSRSWLIEVPAGQQVTVTAEMRGANGGEYVAGISLLLECAG